MAYNATEQTELLYDTKWIDIWEARVFSKRNFEEGAKIRCINLIRSNVCLGHGVFIEYKLSILKSISSLG